MLRFIENLVANANIKKCEKDLEDTTIMDIYEVDTAVKMWQNEGMNATKSWERAELTYGLIVKNRTSKFI